jgi:hypothetical protein
VPPSNIGEYSHPWENTCDQGIPSTYTNENRNKNTIFVFNISNKIQMFLSIIAKDNFKPKNSQLALHCNSGKKFLKFSKRDNHKMFFSFSFLYHGNNNEKILKNLMY